MSENSITDSRDGGNDTSLRNEYFKILDRIVKGAEYLGNPLIKQEDYDNHVGLYEELCDKALELRRKL